MKTRWIPIGLAMLAFAGAMLVRVESGPVPPPSAAPPARPRPMDLSSFSAEPPGAPLRLLFLHHSVGGQLLAPLGPERERHAIYESSVNGGGLRQRLTEAGYEVHEAAYDSVVAHRTDIFDWPGKFRTQMDRILRTDMQDATYPDERRNRIVMFKSCYPNSQFVGRGSPPGNAEGRELTLENAKAALRALLPSFAAQPDVLFVYVTAPPVSPHVEGIRAFRWIAKKLRGYPTPREELAASGALALEFESWVADRDGWLRDYPHRNVVVFDYFGVLADPRTGLSRYPSAPTDSHPSAEGNRRAAEAFVPFLNRAVRRAGLVSP